MTLCVQPWSSQSLHEGKAASCEAELSAAGFAARYQRKCVLLSIRNTTIKVQVCFQSINNLTQIIWVSWKNKPGKDLMNKNNRLVSSQLTYRLLIEELKRCCYKFNIFILLVSSFLNVQLEWKQKVFTFVSVFAILPLLLSGCSKLLKHSVSLLGPNDIEQQLSGLCDSRNEGKWIRSLKGFPGKSPDSPAVRTWHLHCRGLGVIPRNEDLSSHVVPLFPKTPPINNFPVLASSAGKPNQAKPKPLNNKHTNKSHFSDIPTSRDITEVRKDHPDR